LEGREVPSITYGLTASNLLVRFDSNSPTLASAIQITGLQSPSEHVIGIDFRPRTGQLYAITIPIGTVANGLVSTYVINPQSGAAKFVGSIPGTVPGAADVQTGFDFNPTVDRIRVTNVNGANFRINPNDGSLAANDPTLSFTLPATGPIIATAYDRNFDRANGSTIPTTLYAIDRGSNSLDTIGGIDGTPSPNTGMVSRVGPLGVTLDPGSSAGFDIAVGRINNSLGTALATLTVGGVTGLYSINLTTGAATLLGNVGNGLTPLTSLAVVPDSVIAVGSGLGANGDVRILDATTGAVRVAIVPFAGFQGGVRVALGDVTGDGIPDVIVSAIFPQGHVKVFNGATGAEVFSFLAFAGFNGTVNVAAGDVNGDGFDDIIVTANGVNGHVKAFSGKDGSLLASFLAYPGFMGNTTVAAADFNLDGRAEIVTAAAVNGHVKVFNSDGTPFVGPSGFSSSFFAYQGFVGDVFVAAGDVNGDGLPDIVTVSGAPTNGVVKAFSGQNGAQIASFIPNGFTGLPPTQFGTINAIGLADVNADGLLDIVVTPGVGLQADVTAFNLSGVRLGTTIAFANFRGGATVAGARA
jgi:hypothetical protein